MCIWKHIYIMFITRWSVHNSYYMRSFQWAKFPVGHNSYLTINPFRNRHWHMDFPPIIINMPIHIDWNVTKLNVYTVSWSLQQSGSIALASFGAPLLWGSDLLSGFKKATIVSLFLWPFSHTTKGLSLMALRRRYAYDTAGRSRQNPIPEPVIIATSIQRL